MHKVNFLQRLYRNILIKLGIIEVVAVEKADMCKQAQSVCNHNCESCAWRER